MDPEQEYIIETKHITKVYPGVVALKDISIGFSTGEIHAIVGENGAGKSTLIKLFSGAIEPTSGELYYEGKKLYNHNPYLALNMGIGVIYQEFNLVPYLTVAENLFLGKEIKSGPLVKRKVMENKSKEIFKSLGVILDPTVQVRRLSVAYQQIVEICKVLTAKVKVLILDEPTAPLTITEVDYLFKLIKKLKNEGVCIIYISHRLEEIFQVADKITVLRDGQYIATRDVEKTNRNELISLMVGRKLVDVYPKKTNVAGETALEVKDLNREGVLNDINLNVKKGEILGISGLIGSGRTELARAIFGADKVNKGELYLNSKKISIKSPTDAIKKGIGLIPEDRKRHGLILNDTVSQNIIISSIKNASHYLFVNKNLEKKFVHSMIEKLDIKTPSIKQIVKNLSGGNQQKVILAKWLLTNSEVLIFDEPTRGIDVNAKYEIYKLICELADNGIAIIMISSEMPELIGLSDRIIVMCKGRIAGELGKNEVTQEKLLEMASAGY